MRNRAQWEGRSIFAADGSEVGSIEEIFVDKETQEPEWAVVKRGLLGGRAIVPIRAATLRDDGFTVPFSDEQIAAAPNVQGNEISQDEERAITAHYGLSYSEQRSSTGLPEPRGRDRGASDARASDRVAPGRTRDELYAEAKLLEIPGRSKMNKRELARAVESARRRTRERGETGIANPVDVQSFLEGVGYPTRKADLVREAEDQGASEDVLATLKRIREEKFDSPADVSEAIGRLR